MHVRMNVCLMCFCVQMCVTQNGKNCVPVGILGVCVFDEPLALLAPQPTF